MVIAETGLKEFNEVLEIMHPDDNTVVRSAQLVDNIGWLVLYDVGDKFEPWVMNVVAGIVKWAHPVDYDVTQPARLQPIGGTVVGTTWGEAQADVAKAHPFD